MTIAVKATLVAGLMMIGASSQAVADALTDGQKELLRGDYSAAMAGLLPQAERGNAEAQYEVGRMYEGGEGVVKDYAKAASWYQRSSSAGDHLAQFLLSLMYARGQGVTQDDKQGLYWLSKAIEGESPQKQSAAKTFYFETRGGFDQGRRLSPAELTARALPEIKQRADQGDPHNRCVLLQLYETGQAVPRKSDDLTSLHRTCIEMGYESKGRPPPPPLPIPPARN